MGVPWEGPEYNRAVYAILGNCCYFSGIERQWRTSTINAAESIVQAIAEQEGLPIAALRWFDLQTHLGYQIRRGEYELDELLIGPTGDLQPKEGGTAEIEVAGERAVVFTQSRPDFSVTAWRRAACPAEVLQLFRAYIDVPRALVFGLTPEEARARGYTPTYSDDCLELITHTAKSWMIGNPDFAVAVVDNEGHPGDLALRGGKRYTIWHKDETPP